MSTLAIGGLFKGALVGTEAYADYINSTGGVNGRKIVVDSADDQYTGTGNKQATQNAVSTDVALVGGFSTFDSFGGAVLAQNPGVPDVTEVLDSDHQHAPQRVQPGPPRGRVAGGAAPVLQEQVRDPTRAEGGHRGRRPALGREADWAGEKYVMEKVGYKVIYDQPYADTQTDFTQNVIAMKNAGVKVIFIDQMPAGLRLGPAEGPRPAGLPPAGGARRRHLLQCAHPGLRWRRPRSTVRYLDQNTSLYLGGDASTIPAVGTFLHWVNVASPGFKTDLFTLYGWNSAEPVRRRP